MKRITIRVLLLVLILSIAVASAAWLRKRSAVPHGEVASSGPIAIQPANIEKNNIYFARGTFTSSGYEPIMIALFSNVLQQMHELPMQLGHSNIETETYRFLWLRSFDPGVGIRVTKCASGYCLSVKLLDSVDHMTRGKISENAKLAIDRSRAMSETESRKFFSLMEDAGFWQLPTFEERLILDGSE